MQSILLTILVVLGSVSIYPVLAQTSNGKQGSKPALNSTVTVEFNKEQSQLTFTVKPGKGLAINDEGPFSLQIKNGTAGENPPRLTKKDFDFAKSNFAIPISKTKENTQLSISYKLVAFVCTKDKSICYRDVHEETAKVNL